MYCKCHTNESNHFGFALAIQCLPMCGVQQCSWHTFHCMACDWLSDTTGCKSSHSLDHWLSRDCLDSDWLSARQTESPLDCIQTVLSLIWMLASIGKQLVSQLMSSFRSTDRPSKVWTLWTNRSAISGLIGSTDETQSRLKSVMTRARSFDFELNWILIFDLIADKELTIVWSADTRVGMQWTRCQHVFTNTTTECHDTTTLCSTKTSLVDCRRQWVVRLWFVTKMWAEWQSFASQTTNKDFFESWQMSANTCDHWLTKICMSISDH